MNKTIVITGASSGIGEALSHKLNTKGNTLLLLSRRSIDLNKYSHNANVTHFRCDLTKLEDIQRTITKIKSTFSNIDLLISSAGIGIYKKFEESTYEDWNMTFDLNVRGIFLLTQKLLPLFNPDCSLVVNIGSGAGVMGMKDRSIYCASKFALRGLTLSLQEEFTNTSHKFTYITLGSTLTGFGGVPIDVKMKQFEAGKAYFPVNFVADKLVEIINSKAVEPEYILYPSDFGFGQWKKP